MKKVSIEFKGHGRDVFSVGGSDVGNHPVGVADDDLEFPSSCHREKGKGKQNGSSCRSLSGRKMKREYSVVPSTIASATFVTQLMIRKLDEIIPRLHQRF